MMVTPRWILSLICIVIVVFSLAEQTAAEDDELYEEDDLEELIEDFRDRWSAVPLELLRQYTVRERRDAIRRGDIAALEDDGTAQGDDHVLARAVRSGGNGRRQRRGRSRRRRRRRRKLTSEERAELRRLRRLRKQEEKKQQQQDGEEREKDEKEEAYRVRQAFKEALEEGNEAVLERMLDMDIDMEIDMPKICQKLKLHPRNETVDCTPRVIDEDGRTSNRYRTRDGSCNHGNELENPTWGKTVTPLVRWLPAEYSQSGQFLPRHYHGSPRDPSRFVVELDDGRAELAQDGVTILIMHWGQFTDHDITHTPASKEPCDCESMNSNCYPLMIPDEDPIFSEKCFKIPRSLSHCGDASAREQFNDITAFIDASNVYGSTYNESENLRYHVQNGHEYTAATTGRLRMTENPSGDKSDPKLPLLPCQPLGACFGEIKSEEQDGQNIACGEAGDFRVNEQPGLASLHTIFVRLHNVVVEKLLAVNPQWVGNSYLVFEEARKIVGAIMQSIDYNEYLPTLLGDTQFNEIIGEYSGFDRAVDPSISNVFATAGYRQGHSAVDNVLWRYRDSDSGAERLEDLPLDKAFFNAFFMFDFENGGIDGFVQGMVRQPARKIDRFIVRPLANRLFVAPAADSDATGLDIVGLNVLRGRDHGIPPYYRWREYCGLSQCNTWSDLAAVMSAETIEKLQEAYGDRDEDVKDIDAFIGFVSEELIAGGTIGPTLACIIGQQFKKLRDGDRFYYENPEGDQAFTADQRQVINDTTLARVFCETLDDPVGFQQNVFRSASESNRYIDCSDVENMPDIDLSAWCEPADSVHCRNSLDGYIQLEAASANSVLSDKSGFGPKE